MHIARIMELKYSSSEDSRGCQHLTCTIAVVEVQMARGVKGFDELVEYIAENNEGISCAENECAHIPTHGVC